MTDRELLEKAAKAAGIHLMDTDSQVEAIAGPRYWDDVACMAVFWNPLINDGDALRLAVKLRLDVEWTRDARDRVVAMIPGNAVWGENSGDDAHAATRRAIVHAAAEIGRVRR